MSIPKAHKSDTELFADLSKEQREAEIAFAKLYQRHAPRVFAYCHKIMGNYESAQDAFQETFIRFYKSARIERTMTNVAGYLLRIARNICLNMKRKYPNEQQTIQLLDDMRAINYTYSLEKKELLQLIDMALELLPESYREVFVLREYDGLTYAEIAEITNASVASIKIRVFRAKQRIREILAPYLEDLSKT